MAFGAHVFSLVIVCLLFSGCYESKYPLSSSDASRIDTRLLKGWVEEAQSPGDKPYRVEICKFNDREYFVAFCNDNGTATIARAFTSMIGNVPVLNMQGIESGKPEDRTFVFFKYCFLTRRQPPDMDDQQRFAASGEEDLFLPDRFCGIYQKAYS